MGDMKCPFCKQELFYTYQQDGIIPNPNKGKVIAVFCDNCKMYGNEKLWQELIRTRKVLSDTIKLAEEMLKDIEYEGLCSWEYKERLNKIAEQKE